MAKSSLAGLRLPPRGGVPTIVLRTVPAIAEIELLIRVPGADWRPDFEAKCDAASLALFGITEADTRPAEPHPDNFGNDHGRVSAHFFDDKAFASYASALDAWHSWMATFEEIEADVKQVGAARYWGRRAIDVSMGYGIELDCFPRFARQLIVSEHKLLPGAVLTPNATGKRGPQSVEEWGAALAAEAVRYKPKR